MLKVIHPMGGSVGEQHFNIKNCSLYESAKTGVNKYKYLVVSVF